jgi:hypothetical protein
MRQLKDGTMKPKPSAVKAAQWMAQEPLPMRSMRKKTSVRVFMGAGWEKGTVVEWSAGGITVYLPRKKGNTTVRDNRNIKEDSSK